MGATEAAESAKGSDFELGVFKVRPRRLQVEGPQGTERLQPRVMAVLVQLSDCAGQVVTRDELLARVWRGAVVSDDALNRCVGELRRVLRLSGAPDPIETVPRIGYRLTLLVRASPAHEPQVDASLLPSPPPAFAEVAPVAESQPAGSDASSIDRRWLLAATLVIVIAALFVWQSHRASMREQPAPSRAGTVPDSMNLATANSATASAPADGTLAVLPFVNLTGDAANDYLGDGIAEELLDRLAAIPGLRVTGRTSSFGFKDRHLDLRAIGVRLGVRHLLEGSVRRVGDRLRIGAQLVDSSTGLTSWSHTFERPFSAAFSLQTDIAGAVAAQLQVLLPAGTSENASAPASDVYQYYLRGRYAFQRRRDSASVSEAIRDFEAAIRADQDFDLAHASLAAALAVLPTYNEGQDRVDLLDRAQSEARRAIALRPNNGLAYAVLGYCSMGTDPLLAQRNLERALALSPNLVEAHYWMQVFLLTVGRVKRAIEAGERAVALDPLSAPIYGSLAEAYFLAGDLTQADRSIRQAQSLGIGDHNQILSKLALAIGDLDASTRLWAASDSATDLSVYRAVNEGLLDARKLDAARRQAEPELAKLSWPERGWAQLNMRLMLGDLDGALRALDELETKLGRRRAMLNFESTDLWDPQSQIRSRYDDPAFQTLLQRTGLTLYFKESGVTPDICRWMGDQLRCSAPK